MRIAIVTFHNAFNYGATLQCVALSYMLSKEGMEVSVIDYLPKYVEDKKSVFRYLKSIKNSNNKIKGLAKGVAYLRFAGDIQKRNSAFDDFVRQNVKLTETYVTWKDLEMNPPAADAYICGSDQVWNKVITNNCFDRAFFLQFVKSGLRIAYAVSLGETSPSGNKDELLTLTRGFDFISVREENVAKELRKVLSRDVATGIDPTLFLEEADYSIFEKPVDFAQIRYLLLYNIQNSALSISLAEKIAREKNLSIIDISPNPFQKVKGSIKKIYVGPGEFLTLVKNAEFIVTNSFHGMAFSLIYKKQFYTVPHKKRPERMISLLRLSGLESRIINSSNDELSYSLIDYDNVSEKIRKVSEVSKTLLLNAIER